MIGRFWPWLAALIIFLGVGFFVSDSQLKSSSRRAQAAVDACYRARAMEAGAEVETYKAPPEVSSECFRPYHEHEANNGPYIAGGGAGLGAALLFLAAIFFWRRASGRGVDAA